ncbi:MAG: hypothetical protein AB7F19_05190 [Candidatus Babeliales bacterium]
MKIKLLGLGVLLPTFALSMELVPQNQAPAPVAAKQPHAILDLEAGLQSNPALDIDLVSAIRYGGASRICALIAQPRVNDATRADAAAPQPTNAATLVSALELVNTNLNSEQSKLIHSQLEQIFPRFKFAVAPSFATLGAAVAFALTAARYAQNAGTNTTLDTVQLSLTLAGAAGAGAATLHRAIKEIIKGCRDTRQAKAVEKLHDAKLVLSILQQNGINADGSIKPEYLELINKQKQLIAVLTLEEAQATVAADDTTTPAHSTDATAAPTRTVPMSADNNNNVGNDTADGAPITRSQVTTDDLEMEFIEEDGTTRAPQKSLIAAPTIEAATQALDAAIDAAAQGVTPSEELQAALTEADQTPTAQAQATSGGALLTHELLDQLFPAAHDAAPADAAAPEQVASAQVEQQAAHPEVPTEPAKNVERQAATPAAQPDAAQVEQALQEQYTQGVTTEAPDFVADENPAAQSAAPAEQATQAQGEQAQATANNNNANNNNDAEAEFLRN